MMLMSLLSGCGGGVMGAIKVATARAILSEKWDTGDAIVTILADVIGSGIKEVVAQIKKIGSSHTSPIILTRNNEGNYVGNYKPDTSTASEPTEYSVVVTATDESGNAASSTPTTFEVPSATVE